MGEITHRKVDRAGAICPLFEHGAVTPGPHGGTFFEKISRHPLELFCHWRVRSAWAARQSRRGDLRRWVAVALCSIAWGSEGSAEGFADVVVEYFDSGNGSLACPEGQGGSFPPSATVPTCVPLSVVLGDDPNYPTEPADYLSLPMGSFITLGFVDEVIIDGEGDDLFIQEVGDALEIADIYVSSLLSTDPSDFVLLGQADGNTISSFDLGAIGFTGQVRAVKIVSLQNGGAPAAPGFDLANVQALEFEAIPPAVPSSSALGLILLCALAGVAWARALPRSLVR